VFGVESTKSRKPTQLFIESPENLIPLEGKFFIEKTSPIFLDNMNYVQ
jgi:hypothetical protein